jgi:alpha-tubulin suppressor-like RCC1 family protein
MINRQILISRLESFINTSTNTGGYTSEEIVSLALAIQSLKENNIILVESIADLPDLLLPTTYISNGSVYFIRENLIHVVKLSNKWMTLDGVTVTNTRQEEIYSFGFNNRGQLGDGTTINTSSPVSVVGGFTDWCQVSSSRGDCHSLGVRRNGTAWAWGAGGSGRLGDGTAVSNSKSSPVSVLGGFTDWCQVSAGRAHSLGVRKNGTAWAWGAGSFGRLGDNCTVNRSSPVSVVGGFTDWCQVSAGYLHSLGVRKNGTAWAWGDNEFGGQLGDGTFFIRSSPVSVVGGFTDWCQVSAGECNSLGVRQNGTAWGWGRNDCGSLGNGTVFYFRSPVSVVGGFTDWCQVSAGDKFSLGVRKNGTAWAWGCNGLGSPFTVGGYLGDGTNTNRSSPVSVLGGFTDWCQVSAGLLHSLGVRRNGTAWAWGRNEGVLGDGTTTDKSSPVSIVGGFTDWCQVSAGRSHSLVIKSQ